MLAAGTLAQASYASIPLGVAVLAPALRARYGLSLTQVGVVLAAPNVGAIPTLYPWGMAADRLGERVVVGSGLLASAGALAGAAYAHSFWPLAGCLFAGGAAGAAVNAASGRAVLHWFEAGERGTALGIRQTAMPLGGAWTSFLLPALVAREDPSAAVLVLALALGVGALVALAVLREGPVAAEPARAAAPHRDRAMWLLSAGSGLVIAPQTCMVGFLVLFLHIHRGLSPAAAGEVLGVVNLAGIGARIGAGRWSDVVGSRLRPFRQIAVACALLTAAATVLLGAPLWALVPVLVAASIVAISWNSLSFTAAAEAAGHARSGTAIGLQQSVLAVAGAVYPVAFAAFVAATSWRAAFAVLAVFPLAGWRLLASVPG